MPVTKAISAEKAAGILREVQPNEGFHFYRAIDSPLNSSARSLKDFLGHVKTVEAQSLDFHTGRQDFERWVAMLGDQALVEKLSAIRVAGIQGDKLRSRLYMTVKARTDQLTKLSRKVSR